MNELKEVISFFGRIKGEQEQFSYERDGEKKRAAGKGEGGNRRGGIIKSQSSHKIVR
jgi:hypothetical protein